VPDPDEKVRIEFGKAIIADSNAVSDIIWKELETQYDEPTRVNLVTFVGAMMATTVFTNVVEVDLMTTPWTQFDMRDDAPKEPIKGD